MGRFLAHDDRLTKAEGRIDSITPLIELCELPIDQRFPFLLPDGKRARTVTGIVDWCAKKSGCSAGTIWRTYALLRSDGPNAILLRSRKDKGTSRWFARYEKAAEFAAYLRLAWGQNFTEIYNIIQRDHDHLEIPPAQIPSYETVRAWLRSNPVGLVALALEGQKAHRARIALDAKQGFLTERKEREA